tara:strand:+ start:1109 stop:1294 length:186 start_codon:yes stop_codon:yes gene_type:complete
VPNVRHADRRAINLFIQKDSKAMLKAEADRRGISMTELIEEMIENEVRRKQHGKAQVSAGR